MICDYRLIFAATGGALFVAGLQCLRALSCSSVRRLPSAEADDVEGLAFVERLQLLSRRNTTLTTDNGPKTYAASVDTLIVGGCAAGLATAACLQAVCKSTHGRTQRGVDIHSADVCSSAYLVVEQHDRPGDQWRHHRYRRLRLHDRADECHLPFLRMPDIFPEYVPAADYADYLDSYAHLLKLRVLCGHRVTSVTQETEEHSDGSQLKVWIATISPTGCGAGSTSGGFLVRARHLVMATGVYTDPIIPTTPSVPSPRIIPVEPTIEGRAAFTGPVLHSSQYTNAAALLAELANISCDTADSSGRRRVLVVGFGSSGAEIALDLAEHGALPTVLLRSRRISVIPRVLTTSLQWLLHRAQHLLLVPFVAPLGVPLLVATVDVCAAAINRVAFGPESETGIGRSRIPPFFEMVRTLRPPLIDTGALAAIRRGEIRAICGYKILRFVTGGVEIVPTNTAHSSPVVAMFVAADAVVFATGFHVLSAHAALLPPDVAASIGTGRAAVGSIFSAFASRTGGAVSFWTGAVRGHATLWFVYNRLQMISLMARSVATSIAKETGTFNGLDIQPTRRWLRAVALVNGLAMSVAVYSVLMARTTRWYKLSSKHS